MELLWKGIGICLITCVLIMFTSKQERDIALILALAGTVAVSAIMVTYLKPVIEFLGHLSELASLNADHLNVLIKASGVAIISEMASLICSDSGNSGLANAVKLLGSAVILWFSIPVFQSLVKIICTVLGDS